MPGGTQAAGTKHSGESVAPSAYTCHRRCGIAYDLCYTNQEARYPGRWFVLCVFAEWVSCVWRLFRASTWIVFLSVVRGWGTSLSLYLGACPSSKHSSRDTSMRAPCAVSRYNACCLRRTLVHICTHAHSSQTKHIDFSVCGKENSCLCVGGSVGHDGKGVLVRGLIGEVEDQARLRERDVALDLRALRVRGAASLRIRRGITAEPAAHYLPLLSPGFSRFLPSRIYA